MGLGYAEDPRMAAHYRFAAHAQVLAAHPSLEWVAVVDPSAEARRLASQRWSVPCTVDDARDLLDLDVEIDLVVLATPAGARDAVLDALAPRALLVEKPLGASAEEARAFAATCASSGLVAQVNLWRRADPLLRSLAAGGLVERVGRLQAVTAVYGRGLRNNGTHVLDQLEMLCGRIAWVQALAAAEGPVPGDLDVTFACGWDGGLVATVHALDFRAYREVGLEVWGTEGRLRIDQEGLLTTVFPRVEARSETGASEVAADRGCPLAPTVGEALWHVHDTLVQAVLHGAPLVAPLSVGVRAAELVDAVERSLAGGGARIEP
jgi:predicted dehydrogenase